MVTAFAGRSVITGLRQWSSIADAFLWCAYLASLLIISFIPGRFDTSTWLHFAGIFYLIFTLYVISACFGMRCNWLALQRARWVIASLLLMLVWLFLQTIIPADGHFLSEIPSSSPAPDWFAPDFSLSVVPEKTRWLLITNIFVFAWFLMSLAILHRRRRVQQLLIMLLVIGSSHAIIGSVAMYADVHLVDREQLDGHYRAARAWFVNRNHFAAFLNLTLVGSFAYMYRNSISTTSRSWLAELLDQLLSPSLLYYAAAVVILIGIILSQSRGGLASLILGILTAIIAARHSRSSSRIAWQRMLPLVLLSLLILLYFGQDLLARLGSDALSLGERTQQWQITWMAITKSPMLGYGGGSYGTVFQIFREYADLRQVLYNQSHNEYLHIWLEQGLVGLSLWLAIVLLSLRRAYASMRRSGTSLARSVSAGSLIVLVAASLQAGVDFNLQIVNIRCFFFVIIALVFAAPTIQRHSGRNTSIA